MNDPRWLRWLELTEAALEAPESEALDAFDALCAERAALQESLAREPAGPVDAALAGRLATAEAALSQRLQALRDEVVARTRNVRAARSGTAGYRPAIANRPAFVSRSI